MPTPRAMFRILRFMFALRVKQTCTAPRNSSDRNIAQEINVVCKGRLSLKPFTHCKSFIINMLYYIFQHEIMAVGIQILTDYITINVGLQLKSLQCTCNLSTKEHTIITPG